MNNCQTNTSEEDLTDPRVTIRVIQPVIDREMDMGGPISLEPGHIEEDIFLDEYGCAEINYG